MRSLVAAARGGATPDRKTGASLLDFMRRKSIDIVASTAPYWKHVRYERQRHILAEAARLARENAGGPTASLVPLLIPPFDGDRTFTVAEYRDALEKAMTAVRDDRLAIVSAQADQRERIMRAHGAGALDDAARAGIRAAIQKSLQPGARARSWAGRMGVSTWERVAGS
jgi:hypothetical protein